MIMRVSAGRLVLTMRELQRYSRVKTFPFAEEIARLRTRKLFWELQRLSLSHLVLLGCFWLHQLITSKWAEQMVPRKLELKDHPVTIKYYSEKLRTVS